MSPEFSYLRMADSFDRAYTLLLTHPIDHVIRFFVESCDDETWIKETDGELMKKLFKWLTQQLWEGKIQIPQLLPISENIQAHYRVLNHSLEKDIDLIVAGEIYPVCSLLFVAQSHYFQNLILKFKRREGRSQIRVPDIPSAHFLSIQEFIDTSKIELLWREEPPVILDLLKLATRIGLNKMARFVADVYKRYIDIDNVLSHLQMAFREGLLTLADECGAYLAKRYPGFELKFYEGEGYLVELSTYSDELMQVLNPLTLMIIGISCRNKTLIDQQVIEWIVQCSRLRAIDFSDTDFIDPRIIEKFPSVTLLRLRGCTWLTDELFIKISSHCSQLQVLDLSRNTQLTLRTWGALADSKALTDLDISHCQQIEDDELDLLVSSATRLTRLVIEDCPKITDQGLYYVSNHCSDLHELNLSKCPEITPRGILQLISRCRALEDLSIEGVQGGGAALKAQLQRQLPSLKEIRY